MDLDKLKVRRSFIFTPGLRPEMFPKALVSGADMVCIELEDGIAINDKDEARKNTIEALKTLEVQVHLEGHLLLLLRLALLVVHHHQDHRANHLGLLFLHQAVHLLCYS